jgi:hypothetical protein
MFAGAAATASSACAGSSLINAMHGDDLCTLTCPCKRGLNCRGRLHVTLEAKLGFHPFAPSLGD